MIEEERTFLSVCEDIWKVKSIQHFYCFWYIVFEEKLLVYLFCLQNKWKNDYSVWLVIDQTCVQDPTRATRCFLEHEQNT